MGKLFKAKKHKKQLFKMRYLVYAFIVYLSFDTTYAYLLNKSSSINNSSYLEILLSDTNHHFNYNYKPKDFFNRAISFLSNIDFDDPTSFLSINVETEAVPTVMASNTTYADNYDLDEQEKVTEYVRDPNPTTVSKPRIYIYNSHQLENYNAADLEAYNITPNVMMASYMLKEKLNDLGIQTIANDFNLAEFIRANNWSHADSYKASRIFILDAKSSYSSLEYYIDIHRDSIKKAESTKTIDGKGYARILFVVGKENLNYSQNLTLANTLSSKINAKYAGLSRGVIQKEGVGVNGVYNQDISPNSMLIEVGGYQNTLEEVMCTVDAIAKVLYDYIAGEL
jgi:stage II sporulation protein P